MPKDSPETETLGAIDELNSAIGLARSFCSAAKTPAEEEVHGILLGIQRDLLGLGAAVASPEPEACGKPSEDDVRRLDDLRERCLGELSPLREFIVPGGDTVSAALHLARAVARRAERAAVRLQREHPIPRMAVIYLNRLSDLLFHLARWASEDKG